MHSLFKYLRLKSFWTGKPHNNTSKAAMSLLFGASIPVCIMSVYQLSIVVDAPPSQVRLALLQKSGGPNLMPLSGSNMSKDRKKAKFLSFAKPITHGNCEKGSPSGDIPGCIEEPLYSPGARSDNVLQHVFPGWCAHFHRHPRASGQFVFSPSDIHTLPL